MVRRLASLTPVKNVLVMCLTFSPDHPDHLILFRDYVSRKAAGKVKAVLEGLRLDSSTIRACITSNPNDDEGAAQAGLTRWKEGQGQQPPSWAVLIEAMEYARIAQQQVQGLKKKLGLSSKLFALMSCM